MADFRGNDYVDAGAAKLLEVLVTTGYPAVEVLNDSRWLRKVVESDGSLADFRPYVSMRFGNSTYLEHFRALALEQLREPRS